MNTFIFILLLCFYWAKGQQQPCPFNKEECKCMDDTPPAPFHYRLVDCRSKNGMLPKFTPSPDAKYNITFEFAIANADLTVIPAGHFDAFNNLAGLRLEHKPAYSGQPTQINWDDHVFDGMDVKTVIAVGLDGILPLPNALSNQPLEMVTVSDVVNPISLPDQAFKSVPTLDTLGIYSSKIKEFSPTALAGLENSFYWLSLSDSNVTTTEIGAALKGMKKFERLELPKCSITEIKKDDFSDVPRLRSIDLVENPLSKIENGAFSNGLTNLRCVTMGRTFLSSIDLGLFSDIKRDWIIPQLSNFNVFLGYNEYLKNLTTSVVDRFPQMSYVSVDNGALEIIDPSINQLLANIPDLTIDIQNSVHLRCEGLAWMSKFDCPDRVIIDGTKCADKNNQPLEDYLKSIDPYSKCHSSPPPVKNPIFLC